MQAEANEAKPRKAAATVMIRAVGSGATKNGTALLRTTDPGIFTLDTSGSGPEVTVRNAGATVGIYGPQATGLSYGNIGYQ